MEGVNGDLAKRRLEEQAEDCQDKYGVRVRLRFEQPDHGGQGDAGGGGEGSLLLDSTCLVLDMGKRIGKGMLGICGGLWEGNVVAGSG